MLRIVLRTLGRRPAYAVLAIVTLTLGVGACLTAVTVTESALLVDLPFPQAKRLVWIGESAKEVSEDGTSFPALRRWGESSSSLSSIGGFTTRDMRLTGGRDPMQVGVTLVSGDFFRTLAVPPFIGRPIAAEDDQAGTRPVAVVSHWFWQSYFGGRSDAVGKLVMLDGIAHQIVGVMPAGFAFPSAQIAAWTPALQSLGAFENTDDVHLLLVIGRLRADLTARSAEAELRQIEANRPSGVRDIEGYRPFVRTLQEQLTQDVRPRIEVLLFIAVLMILLTFANLANMLLIQLVRRRREIAVRRALGASEGNIVAQLVMENAVLTVAGIAGGVVLTAVLLQLARAYAADAAPELATATVSFSATAIASLFGVATLISLAGVGYIQVARADIAAGIKEAAGGQSIARGGARSRDALVSAEIAITVTLLSCAGVLAKSFLAMATDRLGFDSGDVYIGSLARPYPVFTPAEQSRTTIFMTAFLEKLASMPGVHNASISTEAPGGGNKLTSEVLSEGTPSLRRAGVTGVSQDYFSALRIPLRQGRLFTAADRGKPAHDPEPVAIVDRTLAQSLFGNVSPVGKSLKLVDLARDVRIIGVVEAVRQHAAAGESLPQVYLLYDALPLPWVTVIVRSDARPSAVVSYLRGAAAAVDKDQPIADFASLTHVLANRLDQSALYALLLGSGALASVLMTAVGMFGVISLLVAERGREFGIRLSLGATPPQIFLLVVRRSFELAAVGLVTGTVLTVAGARLLSALLYRVDPLDPLVLIICATVAVAIAVLAAVAPARRAARLDPAMVTRVFL
jgi:putative ABC transport system permease protein